MTNLYKVCNMLWATHFHKPINIYNSIIIVQFLSKEQQWVVGNHWAVMDVNLETKQLNMNVKLYSIVNIILRKKFIKYYSQFNYIINCHKN